MADRLCQGMQGRTARLGKERKGRADRQGRSRHIVKAMQGYARQGRADRLG
jgi:hypothetical protein